MFWNPKKNCKIKEYSKENVKRLVIPYIAWAIIGCIYYAILNKYCMQNLFEMLLSYVCFDRKSFIHSSALWILIGICICRELYALLWNLIKNKYIICFICYMISSAINFDLSIRQIFFENAVLAGIYYIFFFSLGNVLCPFFIELPNKFKNYKDYHNWFALAAVFLVMIICTISFFDGINFVLLQNGNVKLCDNIRQMGLPVVLSSGVIVFSMLFQWPLISWIGQNTLVLCAMEWIIKDLFMQIVSMLGIQIYINNDIKCSIFVIILLYLSVKTVPIINIYFPILNGKYNSQKSQKENEVVKKNKNRR